MMKKILSMMMLLVLSMLLFACQEGTVNQGEYPEFTENDIVEISNEELIKLLSTAVEKTTTDDQGIYMSKGDISFNYSEIINSTDEENIMQHITNYIADIDFEGYFSTTDVFADTAINFEANLDVEISNETKNNNETTASTKASFDGSLGVYLLDQCLYLDSDINVENMNRGITTTSSISGKQMLDVSSYLEDLTYPNIDEEVSSLLPEDFDLDEIEGLLEAFPVFNVYEVNQVTYIEFKVDKEAIKDHLVDGYSYLYTMIAGEGPTQGQVDNVIQFISEVDDNFDELDFSLSIAFSSNGLLQIASKCNISMDVEEGSLGVNYSYTLDKVSEMKDNPDDLENYTEVDSIESLIYGFISNIY